MKSRRALLRALAAGTVGLAGCSSDPPESETPTDTMTTATTTRTTERTQTTEEIERACDTEWTADPDWSAERPGLGTPVVTDGHVLVAGDETVFSFAPTDGAEQWSRDVRHEVVATADGAAIVADATERLTALDLADGATRWTVDTPTEHAVWGQTLQVHDGTVYVAAAQVKSPERDVEEEFGRLYAIDVESGDRTLLASLTTEDDEPVEPEHVLADDTGVYVTLDQGGVFGVDHDGTVRWRRYGQSWYYEPTRTGSLLVQPSSYETAALDVDSGETVWTDDRIDQQATAHDGLLYGAAGGSPETYGTVVALDPETAEAEWTSQLDGCGGAPTVGDGVVSLPVSCRKSRIALLDAGRGCYYGSLDDTDDSRTRQAIHDGTLYATLEGIDSATLVAVPLP